MAGGRTWCKGLFGSGVRRRIQGSEAMLRLLCSGPPVAETADRERGKSAPVVAAAVTCYTAPTEHPAPTGVQSTLVTEKSELKTTIVLAMHGSPPSDFPRHETAEFFGLRGRLERAAPADKPALAARLAGLDARMRAWPRTPVNDPYYAGSMDMAAHLGQATGLPVVVGFNEFCAPSLDQALDSAAANPGRILVITPMMTRGGEHAEHDIPAVVAAARQRHPSADIEYLWPYDAAAVAAFLAARIAAASPAA